ncbi:helix-turn-helix domain-containing protein [Hymenobacter sp. DH14]|uniref:Helix-turn-helix domain-containing protein n=1 Tax=Hymenobacter cyanobacteriorum TaxID=2926463 RepID=A0A9X1VDS2_9BACT|nr:helix-turn-helix transcriptional regulator [Hymenobacter cyanobacteriorum]MCI1187309.1 helix-turn-helix domain-containing protein [Hymenobacter cyanobacteriorum]
MVERIRTLLESRQLTPTQFADLIGVARPIVSHILSGRNKPSLEVVQRILAAMPELAMPWLLNGSGPMLAAAGNSGPEMVPTAIAPAALAPASPGIPAPQNAGGTPTIDPVPPKQSANNQYDGTVSRRADASTLPAGSLGEKRLDKAAAPAGRVGKPAPFKPASKLVATPKRFVAIPVATATPTAISEPETMQSQEPFEPSVAVPPVNVVASEVVANPMPAVPHPASQAPVTAGVAPEATSKAPESAMAQALFAGAEKPIRRIVIFYRDGSFADYQPE